MQQRNDPHREKIEPLKNPSVNQEAKKRQQQTDPQITELKGFTDPNEDLEPTLTDGTKAPDKTE